MGKPKNSRSRPLRRALAVVAAADARAHFETFWALVQRLGAVTVVDRAGRAGVLVSKAHWLEMQRGAAAITLRTPRRDDDRNVSGALE